MKSHICEYKWYEYTVHPTIIHWTVGGTESYQFEKYNAKDVLQQYTQGIDKTLPEYKTLSITGPAHKPVFEIEVSWHDETLAVCKGASKKEAQQECAYEACKKLGVI